MPAPFQVGPQYRIKLPWILATMVVGIWQRRQLISLKKAALALSLPAVLKLAQILVENRTTAVHAEKTSGLNDYQRHSPVFLVGSWYTIHRDPALATYVPTLPIQFSRSSPALP